MKSNPTVWQILGALAFFCFPTSCKWGTNLESEASSRPHGLHSQVPWAVVTTPGYLGHQLQTVFKLPILPFADLHAAVPQPWVRGLPQDVKILFSEHNSVAYLLIREPHETSSLVLVDPASGSLLSQYPVGKDRSTAQDFLMLPTGKLAISFLNLNELWIVNPSDGRVEVKLSLERFAGRDGKAEAVGLHLIHDLLAISIAGIDQWNGWRVNPNEAWLILVDFQSYEIVEVLPLSVGNVWKPIQTTAGGYLVLESGNLGELDGKLHWLVRSRNGIDHTWIPWISEKQLGYEISDAWSDGVSGRLFVLGTDNFKSRSGHFFVRVIEPSGEGYQILGSREGGMFRSLSVVRDALGNRLLFVASHHPEHSGFFVFSLDPWKLHSVFIPFGAEEPPEHCVAMP